MDRPGNYENTVSGGKFTPFYEGGHKLQIMDIVETNSRAGKPMVVVYVDGSTDDRQPAYFTKQYNQDTRPNKKWPISGTIYIVTEDATGQCTKTFKGFITCLKESNRGFEPTWGPQFCAKVRGLKIGGIFGLEEYLNTKGEVKTSVRHKFFCNYDVALEQTAPEVKKLANAPVQAPVNNSGFMNVEASVDDELPFA